MNIMKLKFLCLLLFAMHQSVFAATGAGLPLSVTCEVLEDHIKTEAQKRFPGTHIRIEVIPESRDPSARLSASFWNSILMVTPEVSDGAANKELLVYLNSSGEAYTLFEALPDTMQMRSEWCNRGEVLCSYKFRALDGRYCFPRFTLNFSTPDAATGRSYTYKCEDMLPVLEAGFMPTDMNSALTGHLITGFQGDSRLYTYYFLSKDGDVRKIFTQEDESEDLLHTNGHFYRYKHLPGNKLKMDHFNFETWEWKPTNIQDEHTMLASVSARDFDVNSKDPTKIVYLREPKAGLDEWKFFDAAHKAVFDEKVRLIREHWAREGYPFKDAPMEFAWVGWIGNFLGGISSSISFCFPFERPGEVCFKADGTMETRLRGVSDLHAFAPKSYTAELRHVAAQDGYPLPYHIIYQGALGSNRPAVLWIEGGPTVQWDICGSNPLLDWFLQHFLVVVPHERIREGFGYEHYAAGIGNLHEQALLDAIMPMNGLVDSGTVDPKQVVAYGFSYGGYAAASLAMRWKALQAKSAMKANFRFKGFMAEGAYLAPDFKDNNDVHMYTPKGAGVEWNSADHKRLIESFFPLFQPSLDLPLVIIQGAFDHRCAIEDVRAFYERFKEDPLFQAYVEHNGGHISIVDAAPDELGLRIIQNIISRWLPGIMAPQNISTGELAAAKIDVKKGEGLLHSPIP